MKGSGEYKSILQTIIDEAQDKLTAWELSFLSNIEMKLDKGFSLTEDQADKLEQIYSDRVK